MRSGSQPVFGLKPPLLKKLKMPALQHHPLQ